MMNMRFNSALAATATAAVLGVGMAGPAQAQEVETFATSVVAIDPGAGGTFFGGNFPGVFPIALSAAQARAAVLGAPDTAFLTLPGTGEDMGAFVQLSFGLNFGTDATLRIWELGANGESATVSLLTNNGGEVEFDITRGASDIMSFSLGAFAMDLASVGGSYFTGVRIRGLDLLGGSNGFDVDAVSITTPVPEPSTYALMVMGLGAIGWLKRRRRTD